MQIEYEEVPDSNGAVLYSVPELKLNRCWARSREVAEKLAKRYLNRKAAGARLKAARKKV